MNVWKDFRFLLELLAFTWSLFRELNAKMNPHLNVKHHPDSFVNLVFIRWIAFMAYRSSELGNLTFKISDKKLRKAKLGDKFKCREINLRVLADGIKICNYFHKFKLLSKAAPWRLTGVPPRKGTLSTNGDPSTKQRFNCESSTSEAESLRRRVSDVYRPLRVLWRAEVCPHTSLNTLAET